MAKKAISMIYEGNTTQFQPFMVLDILPKIMTTLVVELAQEGLASIKVCSSPTSQLCELF